MKNYILKDKIPVVVDDLIEWGKWIETADRHVGATYVTNNVYVSTVFLGLDHSWFGGPPLLFETMIFGGALDEYQKRYSTWQEAEAGHNLAVHKASHAVWQKLRKCKGKKFDGSFNRMIENRTLMQKLKNLFPVQKDTQDDVLRDMSGNGEKF